VVHARQEEEEEEGKGREGGGGEGYRDRPSTLLEKSSWKRMSLRAEFERKRTYALLSDVSMAVVGAAPPQTVANTAPTTPDTHIRPARGRVMRSGGSV